MLTETCALAASGLARMESAPAAASIAIRVFMVGLLCIGMIIYGKFSQRA
jgi:hypothetical protein